jgi:hypothetical protein
VAALENHIMLSSEDEAAQERIPPGHCWVLADNEALGPPDVIDSRAFGYLDMSLIEGRVIYRVSGVCDCVCVEGRETGPEECGTCGCGQGGLFQIQQAPANSR